MSTSQPLLAPWDREVIGRHPLRGARGRRRAMCSRRGRGVAPAHPRACRMRASSWSCLHAHMTRARGAQAYRRVLDAIKAGSGLPEEAILDMRGALPTLVYLTLLPWLPAWGSAGAAAAGARAGCCAQPGAARAAGAAWRGRPLCLCLVRCLRQQAPADQRLPRVAMREAVTPGWRCLCAPWAARPDTQSLHRCLARRKPRRLQRATEVPPARVPAPQRPCSAAGWLFPVCMGGCPPPAWAPLHPLILHTSGRPPGKTPGLHRQHHPNPNSNPDFG